MSFAGCIWSYHASTRPSVVRAETGPLQIGQGAPGTFCKSNWRTVMRSLFGMDVVISPDIPNYTLPEEVMPGIPWPPGFRDDINRWARVSCGVTNLHPRGTVYVLHGRTLVMHPLDAVRVTGL